MLLQTKLNLLKVALEILFFQQVRAAQLQTAQQLLKNKLRPKTFEKELKASSVKEIKIKKKGAKPPLNTMQVVRNSCQREIDS